MYVILLLYLILSVTFSMGDSGRYTFYCGFGLYRQPQTKMQQ